MAWSLVIYVSQGLLKSLNMCIYLCFHSIIYLCGPQYAYSGCMLSVLYLFTPLDYA